MLSRLRADPTSRLHYLPSDMFNYYFCPGYVPKALFDNTNKVTKTFRIPGKIRLSSVAIDCNDKYVVILYAHHPNIVALFDRITANLLWQRNLEKSCYDGVTLIEDNYVMITGAVNENTAVHIEIDGSGLIKRGRSDNNFKYTHRGYYVAAVKFEGIWQAEIRFMSNLRLIPLPEQEIEELLGEDPKIVKMYEDNLMDWKKSPLIRLTLNSRLKLCFVTKEKIYMLTGDLDTPMWKVYPHSLIGLVKNVILDDDCNILVLQEKSMSIFTADGQLVNTFPRQFTNAAIYQGIIYGCCHNADAKVLE